MSRKLNSVLFSVFIIILTVNIALAKDWPGFRGPNYNGSTTDGNFGAKTQGQLAVAWREALGSGYSGITIAEGRAITMFSDGKNDVVVAFDAKSGKELWRYALAPTEKGHDGSHDGPIATPVLASGMVFALGPNGHLAAVDVSTGKAIWTTDVKSSHGGKKPYYGFAASPVVINDVVVVEIGAEAGKAVAGFDTRTGKLKWTVGNDVVNYQSPVLIQAGGRQLALAVSDKKLFVIEPSKGEVVLEYAHEGDNAASIMVPVLLDGDRILLRNKNDSADLIRLKQEGSKLAVEKLWTAGVFKNSFAIPVYHNRYLYGFNGRVLTCVDAKDGQTKWRSRGVDDGFLLLVDGNLVIQTKNGKVYVGAANPEGWKEMAQVELFKNLSWTHPSFAAGAVFTRSHGEIARLEWRDVQKQQPVLTTMSFPPGSQFGKLLTQLESSADKKGTVDKFFETQKNFPIVEWPDQITFVYRGEAEDMALSGDLQGQGKEDQMQKAPGTDLYYYTAKLEPDARINYRFIKNYEEQIADPNNPRQFLDHRGKPQSWVSMPGWREPAHLKQAPVGKRGRIESHELKSKVREGGSAKFAVYLPAGYNGSKERYPVVYIFDGALARSQGLLTNTLDNVLGKTVKPMIAVLLDEVKTGPQPQQDSFEEAKAVDAILVKEILPFVDSKYRIKTDAKSRAIAGGLDNGFSALYSVFANPELFGGVATQSVWLQEATEIPLRKIIRNAGEQPLRIYMDWGLYEVRHSGEGWDLAKISQDFAAFLRERGYRPAGGQVHDSYGWLSWRNRTDQLLATLFPANES